MSGNKMAGTENITDMIVFNILQGKGYVNGNFEPLDKNVYVWTKQSGNAVINKLLSNASKRKTGKKGYPDYIIYDSKADFVIVIENKKDVLKHVSKSIKESYTEEPDFLKFDRAEEFAVDGALWYAKNLKEEFDVIAVGVSGNELQNLVIDTYIWKKDAELFHNLNIQTITSIQEYRKILEDKPELKLSKAAVMNERAKKCNDFLRDYLGVIEHERLYVLGAVLFALNDPIFRIGYTKCTDDKDLSGVIWHTVERKIDGSKINDRDIVKNELKSTLLALGESGKEETKEKYPKGALLELVNMVDRILFDYHKNGEIDVISAFFNVFLSYSTSGGSDLGIVLTPPHITKLFCDLAKIDLDSRILDICAGTGGFLTAAWKKIKHGEDSMEKEKIETFRDQQLFGIEKDKSIYTIISLNMFLNKEGNSNIYKGDCFSLEDKIRGFGCNVGFINPPYSDSVYSEIRFVELMLNVLLPGSTGIAILPINAISSRTKKHNRINEIKQRILQSNCLLASIQMPVNLFYPKGTESVILVFRTGEKHHGKTWFAKFDDGYELIKHQKTRTPTDQAGVKYETLLKAYREKSETEFSFNKPVGYEEQWVYTLLTDNEYDITDYDLQETLNEYVSYLFMNHYL